MLRSIIVSTLLSLVLASPVPESGELQARQLMDSNDVESGSCHDVTLIFARGSTEMGNMVCLLWLWKAIKIDTDKPILTIGNRRGTSGL